MNIDDSSNENPRCCGCGTRDHAQEERCPDQPDDPPEWMDDSWGDHNPHYDW